MVDGKIGLRVEERDIDGIAYVMVTLIKDNRLARSVERICRQISSDQLQIIPHLDSLRDFVVQAGATGELSVADMNF